MASSAIRLRSTTQCTARYCPSVLAYALAALPAYAELGTELLYCGTVGDEKRAAVYYGGVCKRSPDPSQDRRQ
eukprot:2789668-Rhodomonas_salina.1